MPPTARPVDDIRLFQIFYREDQRGWLDPAFIPYENTVNERPEWAEYHVFRKEYCAGHCPDGVITGYLSWKFTRKTNLPGHVFETFIRKHPGWDVYFLNPFRVEPKVFPNIWLQGESAHPGLIALTEEILEKAGISLSLADLRHTASQLLYCNYWAGTGRFWRRYMAFCEPVFNVIENGLDEKLRRRVDQRADRVIEACFRPFIMERLFTTLLACDRSLRSKAYEEPRWYSRLG